MDTEHAKIVVAGDIAVDYLQIDCPKNEDHPQNWRKYTGFRWHRRPGGALLIAALLNEAGAEPVISYDIEALTGSDADSVLSSLVRIGPSPDSKKDKVLRVRDFLGYSGAALGAALPRLCDDPTDAAVVILDDAGNGFREDRAAWPAAITAPDSHPLVVLKMSQPLIEGPLFTHLLEHHADRLVVIISANDLRTLGANISLRLSWERTVSDLAWQLTYHPALRPLAQVATLIIRIGIDGALVLQRRTSGPAATFVFDPTGYEDAYKDRFSGDMQGLTPAFVAALARRLANDSEVGIVIGVREGIIASRRLFRLGYGTDPENPACPDAELFPPLIPLQTILERPDEIPEDESVDGPIRTIDLDTLQAIQHDPHWTILRLLERNQLETIAFAIVRQSISALQASVPVARFNNLVVVDRDEIESYQSIRNLLAEYIGNPRIARPFSFAVFGPPGSGKSFGVSELSKGLAPDLIVPMTFNLSQFDSPRDLVGAFHLVRDAALEGKLPLVFFDEFDSGLGDRKLGWLRFFLAPMQDGLFRDGEAMHPIGRAIFVFAGGTSASFDEFAAKAAESANTALGDAKVTDFISRLRGRIDIRGCNPGAGDDGRYLVRRALLLRSILERTAGHLVTSSGKVQIDPGVLRAFLKVPAYRHGVRSMQAIVEMSTLTDGKIFAPSMIPPDEQLALHVNAELFRLLMLQDVLFARVIEPLAQAIHAEYLAHVTPDADGNPPPMAVPWDALTEEFRESNRDQARDIRTKLEAVNCGITPLAMGVTGAVTAFPDDQVEYLSTMEHDRWMAEKQRNGWVAGAIRDNDKKVHPDLVPWDELDEVARDKDRNAIRTIPKLLAEAGFAIYPLP